MENNQVSGIDILEFGNSITLSGMVMHDARTETDLVVMFPGEKRTEVYSDIFPSQEDWYKIQNQLDDTLVEGDRGEGKVLLRRGQRNLDQKICWAVYRRDKYKCRYCGINNVPLTVDHIITWETGGATHQDNLLTSCKKCNKKRGNLDYGSWLQHKYYIERAMKYLTPNERSANDSIIRKLNDLPRAAKIRSR